MSIIDFRRLAKEAGFKDHYSADMWGVMLALDQHVERFAKLVAAAEREACATVAQETVCDQHIPTGIKIYGTKAAKAIRARGKE